MAKDLDEFFEEELVENIEDFDHEEKEEPIEKKAINRHGRSRRNAMIAVFLLGYVILIGAILYYKHEADTSKEPEAEAVNGTAINQEEVYTKAQLEEAVMLAVEDALNNMEVNASTPASESEILDLIRESLMDGTGILDTLRPLYPDQMIIYTGGRYRFYPILENLKRNTYLPENFIATNKGEKQYVVDGEVVSYKGIDVSKHQGEITWSKVKNAGVDFAIVRVGVRGYGTGKVVEDERFEENVKGAINNNIKVGVYFFSQAITKEEAVEEAQFVLERIRPYKIDGPIVFDVEKVQDSSARMNALSVEERTEITLAFLEEIEKNGYKGMIYFNTETAIALLDQSKLEGYEKWFAYYGDDLYYPYDFGIWQYSDKGKIDGIKDAVDLNIALRIWE